MRLTRVELRGITRFGATVAVDFASLPPGLVAVVGNNGAGKSTLLEAVPAALYKAFPSRPGSLYKHAHGRDAYISATFREYGCVIEARLLIDAEARKTESYLFIEGESATQGRAVEYDAQVLRYFGSAELFLASVFAAQNKAGSFLLMPKGDRKELFVELLGIGRLAEVAARAKDQRETSSLELDRLKARQAGFLEAVGDLAAMRDKMAELADAVDLATDKARLLGVEHDEAKEKAVESKAKAQAYVAAVKRHLDARAALTAAEQKASDAQVKAELLDAVVTDEAAALQVLRDKVDRLSSRLLKGTEGGLWELVLKEQREGKAELDEKAAVLNALRTAVIHAEGAVNLAGVSYRTEVARADRALKDVEKRTVLLKRVPCTTRPSWGDPREEAPVDLAGTCPLLADARAAAALNLPAIVEDPDVIRTAVACRDAETKLAGLSVQVADYDGLPEALAACSRAIAEAEAGMAKDRERERALGEWDTQRVRVDGLRDQLEDVRRLRDNRREELDEADRAHDRAKLEADGLAGFDPKGAQDEAIRAQSVYNLAEQALRVAREHEAAKRSELKTREEFNERAEALAPDIQAAGQAMADWLILERAFGRDGIQALEIDAAGPEVAALTNELLSACYGARFTLSFETLREKVSAKGEFQEVFDVKVFDAGHERDVEGLSGGEKVVIGEALGLAFAIFNARKSGVRWETIFRDETAGALDPRNAEAYVEMLRKARALGGFHQVVFVAHQPEVWERADSFVRLGDGKVEASA